ncbi:helix-turn-helix domain-containing protein, partial [Limosilactobacillus reuteri]
MNQTQVAKQIKTSNRAISRHESGKRIPKLEAL